MADQKTTMLEAGDGITVSSIPDQTQHDVYETAAEAGCYAFIEESFSVADGDNGVEAHYVKEIRGFEPVFVPLWVDRAYKSPAGTDVVVGYHVIGRYIEHPRDGAEALPIRLRHVPLGFPFDPTKIHALRTLWAPWPKESVEYANNTPPAYVAWGKWVVEQMRALHKILHGDQTVFESDVLRDILEAESKRDEELMAKAIEEARYRARHNWPQFRKAIENGNWAAPTPNAKPFVDLGGKV